MFLETIRCEGGKGLHLPYHQHRLDTTLLKTGSTASYDLDLLLTPPDEALYRCRFLYDAHNCTVEFHPYTPRIVSALKLLHADDLDYPFKYSDRALLDRLFAQREEADDVLIVRRGFLTDTTIANIALFIDGRWLTPEKPLLPGTTRARLIDEGFLFPAPLRRDAVAEATKIAVMNAMMGFVEVENGIIKS